MSKYEPLWTYVTNQAQDTLLLTYEQIEAVCGFPIDHAFLTCKKELLPLGYEVQKISMKNKTVAFRKLPTP